MNMRHTKKEQYSMFNLEYGDINVILMALDELGKDNPDIGALELAEEIREEVAPIDFTLGIAELIG